MALAPQPANGNNGNAPVSRMTEFGLNLRELVAALISLGIAGLALWMLWDVYAIGKGEHIVADAFQRQKDALMLALGFFGTVTGYYLGRVPAERQADAARAAARTAENSERNVKQRVRAGLANIQQQQGALGGANIAPVNNAINELLATI